MISVPRSCNALNSFCWLLLRITWSKKFTLKPTITHAIALQRSKEVNTPINSKIRFITSQEIQVQTVLTWHVISSKHDQSGELLPQLVPLQRFRQRFYKRH